MKKIFTPFIVVIILFSNHFYALAQCSVYINGDTCTPASLTANSSGSSPKLVKWYRNGILEQIKTKRNPNSVIVAGGGTTPDGQLSEPHDIAVDRHGNIYVIDDGRQRVQKWAPGATEGITVAGGNGKGPNLNQFFTPQGIVVDDEGSIYVSDDLMARVTKWTPGATEGIIVAGGNGEGNAANQLFGPQNICLDVHGNIYIADRWNHRVQKWAPGATQGITVAGGNGNGSGANQLSEPLDVVVDGDNNVYVIDYYNNRVQKWATGAAAGITVAGGNGAGSAANQFKFTTALSITPDGSLYVRDQGNNRVQKWTEGAVAGITVAGGNGYGNEHNTVGPGFGLFVDSLENIYVPELFQNTVNKFVPAATADMQYAAVLNGAYRTVVLHDDGCKNKSALFNVYSVPEKPLRIYGPKNVSEGQAGVIYSVDNLKGDSYYWNVPVDAVIVKGQGKKTITVNWGSSGGFVSVAAINQCGTSKVKKKDVYINTAAFATAKTLSGNVQLNVYPNPVLNAATIMFKSFKASAITIKLEDVTGKVIMIKKTVVIKGDNNINISVDQLSAGIYFIHVMDDKHGTYSMRFLKE